jgi:hypothetical protein
MYALNLGPAIAVLFPSGSFSIRVCIWVIPIVSMWSEDPVRRVSSRSYFRFLTRLGHLTSISVSAPVPRPAGCSAGTILSPDKVYP